MNEIKNKWRKKMNIDVLDVISKRMFGCNYEASKMSKSMQAQVCLKYLRKIVDILNET
jgi:hypothetical protein